VACGRWLLHLGQASSVAARGGAGGGGRSGRRRRQEWAARHSWLDAMVAML